MMSVAHRPLSFFLYIHLSIIDPCCQMCEELDEKSVNTFIL